MQLSKDVRSKLVSELRYCAERISKEKDLRRKAFFYCNAADSVHSILDLEYDSQLVLIGLVLEVSGSMISNRVETILSERDISVELIDGIFDKLHAYLSELAINIEESQDTYKTLEKIAELAFTATERGYYLYTKGVMKT